MLGMGKWLCAQMVDGVVLVEYLIEVSIHTRVKGNNRNIKDRVPSFCDWSKMAIFSHCVDASKRMPFS